MIPDQDTRRRKPKAGSLAFIHCLYLLTVFFARTSIPKGGGKVVTLLAPLIIFVSGEKRVTCVLIFTYFLVLLAIMRRKTAFNETRRTRVVMRPVEVYASDDDEDDFQPPEKHASTTTTKTGRFVFENKHSFPITAASRK